MNSSNKAVLEEEVLDLLRGCFVQLEGVLVLALPDDEGALHPLHDLLAQEPGQMLLLVAEGQGAFTT